METALFKNKMEEVVSRLRETLIRRGFKVSSFDTQKKVLVAYRYGNWYRTPKHLLFAMSNEHQLTRVEITASIETGRKNRNAEEEFEEKIASIMYRLFSTS